MFLASLSAIVGYQLMIFAFFAKTYAITHLGESSSGINRLHRHLTIEKSSLVGILLLLIGGGVYLKIFINWLATDFGELQEIKNSILALTIIVLGAQTIFSSFMLSILGIKER